MILLIHMGVGYAWKGVVVKLPKMQLAYVKST